MSTNVDSNNKNRMLDWTDMDPRNKTTNYLLNGQPYDGPAHPIFGPSGVLGTGKPQYWTGVNHYALSEKLVYTSTPVLMPRDDEELLERAERVPNTIFNTSRPAVFTDTLNDSAGVPLFSRTIIPERLQAGIKSSRAREQPFTDMRSPFAPRQGIGGGPDVLYNPLLSPAELRSRALGGEPVRRPPPESGARAPFTYDPQPEYQPTQPMQDPIIPTPYYPPIEAFSNCEVKLRKPWLCPTFEATSPIRPAARDAASMKFEASLPTPINSPTPGIFASSDFSSAFSPDLAICATLEPIPEPLWRMLPAKLPKR
ncbi:hypothetical protein T492DRAFT_846155 [Pavlovales sp. CCMP2436]|nr:hypothetical protein T492DRAFT_846155 [Pavlovales sp. CCMP2436]